MKQTIALIILLLFPGLSSARPNVPTDSEILEDIYAQSLRKLLPKAEVARRLKLSWNSGFVPSIRARTVTETVLSSLGYSLSDSVREGDRRLIIMITDARCTAEKKGREFERFLSLTIHVRCVDSSGTIVYARGCERSFADRFQKSFLDVTDTSGQFSREIRRSVLKKRPDTVTVLSFLAILTTLTFFALEK